MSGGGLGYTKLRELTGLLKASKIDFEVMITGRPGHGVALGREVKEGGFDALIVLGGDGTVSEVAKGLIGSEIPVANIPAGSGNDLAGTLGIPRDLKKALNVIFNAEIVKIDLFTDNGAVYAETIGSGFAADVVSSVAKMSRYVHGPAAYFAAVFKTLASFKSAMYKVVVDDNIWEGPASMVIINNTFRVGGGMKITPEASLDDGFLDIAIIKTSSKATLLALLPTVYSGKHVNSPYVTIMRGRSFVVEADRELIKMADGDIIGTLPMNVQILPGAMNFFRARKG